MYTGFPCIELGCDRIRLDGYDEFKFNSLPSVSKIGTKLCGVVYIIGVFTQRAGHIHLFVIGRTADSAEGLCQITCDGCIWMKYNYSYYLMVLCGR